jgi:hypothetical protein
MRRVLALLAIVAASLVVIVPATPAKADTTTACVYSETWKLCTYITKTILSGGNVRVTNWTSRLVRRLQGCPDAAFKARTAKFWINAKLIDTYSPVDSPDCVYDESGAHFVWYESGVTGRVGEVPMTVHQDVAFSSNWTGITMPTATAYA